MEPLEHLAAADGALAMRVVLVAHGFHLRHVAVAVQDHVAPSPQRRRGAFGCGQLRRDQVGFAGGRRGEAHDGVVTATSQGESWRRAGDREARPCLDVVLGLVRIVEDRAEHGGPLFTYEGDNS